MMNQLRALTGQAQSNEAPDSVLAEWNQYSTTSAPPTQSDKLMGQMEAGGATLSNAFASSLDVARSGVSSAQATISGGTSSATSFMPSGSQLTYFAAFMGAGIFFVFIAISIYLPFIIISPAKFAAAFTLGSALMMSSFFALKGPSTQLAYMLEKERLLFSIGYVGSIGGTLYASTVMHSYILSLVMCAIQMAALFFYVATNFPGGTAGAQYVMSSIFSMSAGLISGVKSAIFR